MSAVPEIGDERVREIYAWLDEIPLSRAKRHVARDFSDGVMMAELLKRYYPKLVDINNYIPGCSLSNKIENWCTLNRKVLSKIDIKLNKDTINSIAQSQPGAIEKLLYEVRSKIVKDCNKSRSTLFKSYSDSGKEEFKLAMDPEESLNQTVPRKAFLRLKKELEEKTEAINILIKKVEHLESMLRFKEQRIEDLATQIQSSHVKI